MTLPPKLEKMLENWPAKIISLVAAILVYAFYQISTLETRYFVVPLEINKDSGMIPVECSEASVRVSVRGNISEINTMETKDFRAFADMSRFVNEGSVVVPVQLELSDNLRILNDLEIKIQPETVEIKLEKELSAYIPVKLDYAGGTAHGYEIASVDVVPSMIKIRGPRSIVDSLEELDTDAIFFDSLYSDAVYETDLLEINSQLECEHEGPVTVEVSVVPTQMQRNLSNLAVKIIAGPENLIFESDKISASCSVSGNELDVERFSPANGFLYVDCSKITEPGEYDIPVKVKNVYQVTVDSVEPETVHVTVTEKPEEIIAEEEE